MGTRSGQKPTWKADYDRFGNYSINDEYKDERDLKNNTDDSHDYIRRNPRFTKTIEWNEKFDKLKQKHPDAKAKKTKVDEAIEKAKEEHKKELEYANKVASKYVDSDASGHYPGEYQIGTPEYAMAADAARRHYRRHHKNESCGIFESVRFIDE